jgi:uncharacterized membrane protein
MPMCALRKPDESERHFKQKIGINYKHNLLNMKRPRIKLKKNSYDYIWEILGYLGALALILLPLYYYNKLPNEIPVHFGPGGEPDSYKSKNNIWVVSLLGIALFVALNIVNRFPHAFNYMVKITEENAEDEYQRTTRLIRYLNTIIVLMFLYICYTSIEIALGNAIKLNVFYMIVFIALIFGLMIWYLLNKK